MLKIAPIMDFDEVSPIIENLDKKNWPIRILVSFEKNFPHLYERIVCPSKALFLDLIFRSSTKRAIRKIIANEPIPLFNHIEIETINRCNGDCSFCPINRHSDPREFKLMEKDLFLSIINQLRGLNYSGKLALFSSNEPLLDKRIIELSEIARRALPNAFLFIYTNGSLLSVEKLQELMKYLDFLLIDNYNDLPILNKPVKEIYNFIKDKPEYCDRIKIQLIRKNAIRLTRGGQAKNRSNLYFLRSPCIKPFEEFIIRSDGKISLCCNDAVGGSTLGDLSRENILEIWNGEAFRHIRSKLLHGRHLLDQCKNCDVIIMGAASQKRL
jgi:radical SAM protein with 4Fe4S-binding SPASM domain